MLLAVTGRGCGLDPLERIKRPRPVTGVLGSGPVTGIFNATGSGTVTGNTVIVSGTITGTVSGIFTGTLVSELCSGVPGSVLGSGVPGSGLPYGVPGSETVTGVPESEITSMPSGLGTQTETSSPGTFSGEPDSGTQSGTYSRNLGPGGQPTGVNPNLQNPRPQIMSKMVEWESKVRTAGKNRWTAAKGEADGRTAWSKQPF